MKCPKCDITLPNDTDVCPVCQTPITEADRAGNVEEVVPQDTGRFTAIDPSKDSYDFDVQYTLTFKDVGEIRQSIADREFDIVKGRAEQLLHPEKEKEEQKQKPINTDRRVRTKEEMEEAARRAALRRERREQSKRDGAKRSHVEKLTKEEREKARVMRAVKEKRRRSRRGEKKSSSLILGVGVLAVVLAVIIGAVNLFANMMDGEAKSPTVYTKGNQLCIAYKNKTQIASESLVSAYAPQEPEKKGTNKDKSKESSSSKSSSSSSNSKTTKVIDPKLYKSETGTEKKLIYIADDGLSMFFLENVDFNTGEGDLVYYRGDSRKGRTPIASSVYYKIQVSKDGKSVLYLQDGDNTGYHGNLFYWNLEDKESIAVDTDICTANYLFSQDGTSVMYIKNFNPIVNTGDLFVKDLKTKGDGQQIDEKVAFVFGTTPKSDVYLYAKEYDTKEGTYNLYGQKNGSGAEIYAKEAYLPPVVLEKTEGIYAYSNYHDNFQNISYVDFATGKTNLMAKGVTKIDRISKDEMSLIYTKTYETDKSDYFYVGANSTTPQKVANAVKTIKEDPQYKVQFDASEDFSRIAYIGDYDDVNCKGPLFTLSIINGSVSTEKRISDDAYGCDVSTDGAVVRFASAFNKNSATVNLVSYVNSNTVTLAEGVGAAAYTYDRAGEAIAYARNIKVENSVTQGDVECVSTKGKIRKLNEKVNSYGLKKDGTVILSKKDGEYVYIYLSDTKGKNPKLIDEGNIKILSYII